MIQKKVCMVGSFAVGKTSLVSRFVHGIFSEKYLTTVGVKIARNKLELDGRDVRLILWDLHGEDEFRKIRATYLRGASGILLVADGTRPETAEAAFRLREVARVAAGDIPMLCLANKADLDWTVDPSAWEEFAADGIPIVKTSAKTGDGVEAAFRRLGRWMVDGADPGPDDEASSP